MIVLNTILETAVSNFHCLISVTIKTCGFEIKFSETLLQWTTWKRLRCDVEQAISFDGPQPHRKLRSR